MTLYMNIKQLGKRKDTVHKARLNMTQHRVRYGNS